MLLAPCAEDPYALAELQASSAELPEFSELQASCAEDSYAPAELRASSAELPEFSELQASSASSADIRARLLKVQQNIALLSRALDLRGSEEVFEEEKIIVDLITPEPEEAKQEEKDELSDSEANHPTAVESGHGVVTVTARG